MFPIHSRNNEVYIMNLLKNQAQSNNNKKTSKQNKENTNKQTKSPPNQIKIYFILNINDLNNDVAKLSPNGMFIYFTNNDHK